MNQHELALDVLNRLEPELRDRFVVSIADRYDPRLPYQTKLEQELRRELGYEEVEEVIEGSVLENLLLPASTFTLQTYLQSLGPLPPYSLLLGKCEDDIPLLMDLSNPRPGSIMIVGDSQNSMTDLLQVMLRSGCEINAPKLLQIHLISNDQEEYTTLKPFRHLQETIPPWSRKASELIVSLSATIEQRRHGRGRGPVIVLAIDDFSEFITEGFSSDIFPHLKWLIKHGPKSHVWTFALTNTDRWNAINTSLIQSFGTRIFGKIDSSYAARNVTNVDTSIVDTLESDRQFAIEYEREWITFTIPEC